jgi:hypothetical protein
MYIPSVLFRTMAVASNVYILLEACPAMQIFCHRDLFQKGIQTFCGIAGTLLSIL